MKVLHLMAAGGIGGIETLFRNYTEYSEHEHTFLFVFGAGEIAEQLKKSGNEVVCISDIKKNLHKLKKISAYCRRNHFDAIMSHHSSPILKLAVYIIKKQNPKMKVIVYAHANAEDICEHKRKGLWMRKVVHKMGFSAADKVIAISDSVKESLIEYLKVKQEKIEVIYNGVPINRKMKEFRDFSSPIRLIYVGRLIKEKGVQNIIEGLAALTEQEYQFEIVGYGSYQHELEEMVKKYKLENKIVFLGKQHNINELLEGADIFIHAPVWKEGFGITIVEAMAMGKLCVCSAIGAIPEIIENNVNGFLVEAHSTKALADKLREIFEQYEEQRSYITLRENARQDAEKYSITEFTAVLDRMIKLLCS